MRRSMGKESQVGASERHALFGDRRFPYFRGITPEVFENKGAHFGAWVHPDMLMRTKQKKVPGAGVSGLSAAAGEARMNRDETCHGKVSQARRQRRRRRTRNEQG